MVSRLTIHLSKLFAIGLLSICSPTCSGYQTQSNTTPEIRDFSPELEKRISEIVARGIKNEQMPGCVICVGNSKTILFLKAYGLRSEQPFHEPMSIDTIFDLASLTKPVATASAVVKLMEQGLVHLDDPIANYLKAFGQNGKEQVTVLDCLLHRSGLIPDNALADYQSGREVAWENIYRLPLQYPRGSQFKYSDVNFLVLGKLVEEISKQTLDAYVSKEILKPCGMVDSDFLINQSLLVRVAPTEKRDGEWILGTVHDPRAHLLGGVAGHAGLFSTANDLANYSKMILNRGVCKQSNETIVRIFQESSIDSMFEAHDVHGDVRGLGWDMQSRYSSNKGKKLSAISIGHGGFTGTVLWIDRARDMFFCFLSSRLHPDGKGNINPLAGEIWDAICEENAMP
ncbi:MAG: serine hydrolase domain-containing protein [Pirellula sp.]|jgi:CubicO group peptidase (beta-lactamase class C family)